MPSDPLLQAERVSVALGGRPVLRAVSFDVAAGTCVGLLGPNGSGKTTLLRAVSGVLPHEGRLTFDGRPVQRWAPRSLARRLAFVQQSPALTFDLSVRALVAMGRTPHRRWLEPYDARDHALVRQALAQVDLDGFAERSALSLSGGELQRVFLAQALAQEADLLLLDEPTAHLDVHYQFTLMDRVRALVGDGRTVLGVFHDLELAARYADRLLVLSEGRLTAAGPPADVLTPALLARVFRMEARVHREAGGPLRISYLGATPDG